ncbi:hypothetical protein N781_14750 [Pontibacillus halophilus JSM 076056 = DSM 19796]|uniref:Uncharacterized protein n=1 Tax=Pontibacillus halophilus JSM 076056 = DSM 19796 TaxID=1385510 RepID=A0A0A5GHN1_9BACI|nr:hypothetical protein [Pontibacillus halophilus]KGX92776.1 hypothetical protein N781_14750 [Pontibacillus halophilus JSM 076056 = DSM 19796]
MSTSNPIVALIELEWTNYDFAKRLTLESNQPFFKEMMEQVQEDAEGNYHYLQTMHYATYGQYVEHSRERISFETFEEGVQLALRHALRTARAYRGWYSASSYTFRDKQVFQSLHNAMDHALMYSTIYGRLR